MQRGIVMTACSLGGQPAPRADAHYLELPSCWIQGSPGPPHPHAEEG